MALERCTTCGRIILTEKEKMEMRLTLGSGRQPSCGCRRPTPRRETPRRETPRRGTPRREPTQNITYVAPAPSITEQLEVLAKLFKEGAITKEEFQTLKTRLISGGMS